MDHHHTALQSAEKKIIWPCLHLKKLSYENSLELSSCIFPGYTDSISYNNYLHFSVQQSSRCTVLRILACALEVKFEFKLKLLNLG